MTACHIYAAAALAVLILAATLLGRGMPADVRDGGVGSIAPQIGDVPCMRCGP